MENCNKIYCWFEFYCDYIVFHELGMLFIALQRSFNSYAVTLFLFVYYMLDGPLSDIFYSIAPIYFLDSPIDRSKHVLVCNSKCRFITQGHLSGK